MTNIWQDINLSDYENHMSLPSIAQAQYLSDNFAKLLDFYSPESLAILGCSGGNGLEHCKKKKFKKIVCVDINQNFLTKAKERYSSYCNDIEFSCQDITSENFQISKVDLIYAALILEYVNLELAIVNISKFINKKGILAVVLQQQNENLPEVSPSQFRSLEKLNQIFKFVSSKKLIEFCFLNNLKLVTQNETQLLSSKKFTELIFQKI